MGSNPTISANKRHQLRLVPFLRLDGADENRAAARRPQAISPAGCCLARGRISTISANKRHQLRLVPFLRLDGADENRAAARRPQAISPAGCCLARGRISTISARSRRLHFETGGIYLYWIDSNTIAIQLFNATAVNCISQRCRLNVARIS